MTGYKTIIGGVGLLGLAVFEATQGHYHDAATHAAAAMVALGLGHKLERLLQATLGGQSNG